MLQRKFVFRYSQLGTLGSTVLEEEEEEEEETLFGINNSRLPLKTTAHQNRPSAPKKHVANKQTVDSTNTK